jgi:hypothetical protein
MRIEFVPRNELHRRPVRKEQESKPEYDELMVRLAL